MLIARTLRFILLIPLVTALPPAASAQQAGGEDLRAGAEYAETMNRLAIRLRQIIDRSIALDDLSVAIAEGRLSAADGRRQGDAVIAELQQTLEVVLGDAAAVEAPLQVDDPRVRQAADALRANFAGVHADTEQAITDSIDLFQAALAGEPEIFAALERRQFDNTILAVERENEAIATTLATIPSGTPGHLHFQIVEQLNLALLDAMMAFRPVLDGQSVGLARLDAADARLAEGRRLIGEARRLVEALLLRLRLFGSPAGVGERNAEAFREAIGTFGPSLDIEAAMAGAIESMILALRDPATAGQGAFDDASVRLAELSDERGVLVLRRQQLFQQLQ